MFFFFYHWHTHGCCCHYCPTWEEFKLFIWKWLTLRLIRNTARKLQWVRKITESCMPTSSSSDRQFLFYTLACFFLFRFFSQFVPKSSLKNLKKQNKTLNTLNISELIAAIVAKQHPFFQRPPPLYVVPKRDKETCRSLTETNHVVQQQIWKSVVCSPSQTLSKWNACQEA